ncbi:unnamed protein product [Paramecium octaurelia]|uniref:Palmitoyltransferase n=1 Tax=Paramecium octaurelia TaxID=43137 RepID=A0A8S1S808_PAROT|nr:unnamed protein product [Paramecium octaurelia]
MDLKKIPFKHILLSFYAVSFYCILESNFGFYGKIGAVTLQFLLMWSHYQIVSTHPGPITITKTPIELMEENNWNINAIKKNERFLVHKCTKCNNNWKPPKTHHCQTCDICVHYRDHHCAWFNCCVGYKNLKYFCQFLMYFMIIIIIHGTLCAIWIWQKIYQIHKDGLINFQLSSLGALFPLNEVITKLFETFIFFGGYFVACQLLIDKFDQIPDLTTYNEQKANKYSYFRASGQKLIRLLGENYIYWILPIPNKLNLNYLELTYPKVTAGEQFLDYHLDMKDKDSYFFYKIFELK